MSAETRPAVTDATAPVAVLWVLLLAIMVSVVAGLVLLRPGDAPTAGASSLLGGPPPERWEGVIADVEVAPLQDDFLLPGSTSLLVTVDLEERGTVVIDAVDEGGLYEPGRRVVVENVAAAGTPELLAIVDLPRGRPLVVLALLFCVAVVLLGRWQGVRALTGLVLSALLIVGWLVPAVLSGGDPMLLALVASAAVMLITLPLSHGVGRPILAAAVGTTLALGLTVLLARVAVDATALTGLASEDIQFVRFASDRVIDLRGLLLAGMIIGTLGVLDDVTVSQASTVAALRRADPAMAAGRVFTEAMSVGRDHIAATVNTLFLAYAGAALPLLLLFSLGGGGVVETITSELVAQEVVRTLVGSIGLIAAVPIVTGLAALVVTGQDGDGHVHGALPSEPVPLPSTSAPEPAAEPAPEPAPDPEAALRRLLGQDRDDR